MTSAGIEEVNVEKEINSGNSLLEVDPRQAECHARNILRVEKTVARDENVNESQKTVKDFCSERGETSQSVYQKMFSFLENGSSALLSKHYNEAIESYKKAMELSKELSMEDNKLIKARKYALSIAYIGLGTYESLGKALDLLKSIKGRIFPAAFYGMALAFEKLNRFKLLMEEVEECEQLLKRLDLDPFRYCWPGNGILIEETQRNVLIERFNELHQKYKYIPKADAVCRLHECLQISSHVVPSTSIYHTDPDFTGYVIIVCEENCRIVYHINCWKHLKEKLMTGLMKIIDKDVLGTKCPTDGCRTDYCNTRDSIIIKITVIDSNGVVKTEMEREKTEYSASSHLSFEPTIAKKIRKRTAAPKSAATKQVSFNRQSKKGKLCQGNVIKDSDSGDINGVETEIEAAIAVLETQREKNFGRNKDIMFDPRIAYYGNDEVEKKYFMVPLLTDDIPEQQQERIFYKMHTNHLEKKEWDSKFELIKLTKDNGYYKSPQNFIKEDGAVPLQLLKSPLFACIDDQLCLAKNIHIMYSQVKDKILTDMRSILPINHSTDSEQEAGSQEFMLTAPSQKEKYVTSDQDKNVTSDQDKNVTSDQDKNDKEELKNNEEAKLTNVENISINSTEKIFNTSDVKNYIYDPLSMENISGFLKELQNFAMEFKPNANNAPFSQQSKDKFTDIINPHLEETINIKQDGICLMDDLSVISGLHDQKEKNMPATLDYQQTVTHISMTASQLETTICDKGKIQELEIKTKFLESNGIKLSPPTKKDEIVNKPEDLLSESSDSTSFYSTIEQSDKNGIIKQLDSSNTKDDFIKTERVTASNENLQANRDNTTSQCEENDHVTVPMLRATAEEFTPSQSSMDHDLLLAVGDVDLMATEAFSYDDPTLLSSNESKTLWGMYKKAEAERRVAEDELALSILRELELKQKLEEQNIEMKKLQDANLKMENRLEKELVRYQKSKAAATARDKDFTDQLEKVKKTLETTRDTLSQTQKENKRLKSSNCDLEKTVAVLEPQIVATQRRLIEVLNGHWSYIMQQNKELALHNVAQMYEALQFLSDNSKPSVRQIYDGIQNWEDLIGTISDINTKFKEKIGLFKGQMKKNKPADNKLNSVEVPKPPTLPVYLIGELLQNDLSNTGNIFGGKSKSMVSTAVQTQTPITYTGGGQCHNGTEMSQFHLPSTSSSIVYPESNNLNSYTHFQHSMPERGPEMSSWKRQGSPTSSAIVPIGTSSNTQYIPNTIQYIPVSAFKAHPPPTTSVLKPPSTFSYNSASGFSVTSKPLAPMNNVPRQTMAAVVKGQTSIPISRGAGQVTLHSKYDKLVRELLETHKNSTENDIREALSIVRDRNNGKLSGLARDEISQRVADIVIEISPKYAATQGIQDVNAHCEPVFEDSDICCICIEPKSEGNVYKLRCRHSFHFKCIRQWIIEEKRCCPVCRSNVKITSLSALEFPNLSYD